MKKTNKGFSLVELIIVIAIMAILAGAIAPALIRYIDKSRKSNDVTAAKSIKTAVETALGNENLYEFMTAGSSVGTDPSGGALSAIISVEPGQATENASGDNTPACVKIAYGTFTDADITNNATTLLATAQKEIATNIGEKMPKCKYKKNAESPKSSTALKPYGFVATVSAKGTVVVYLHCQATGSTTTDVSASGNSISVGTDDNVAMGGSTAATAGNVVWFPMSPSVSSYYQ